jgi:phosphoesterase RecJ-like protein
VSKYDQIGKDIQKAINAGSSFLLHCHPSPDPDSIGSALAMKFYLLGLGKQVTIISGDSTINPAIKLPGIEEIKVANYFQIDISKFDTFIILDSSKKDQISKIKEVVLPDTLNTIVIDHHSSNTGFGKLNLIDTTSPATAQIIFELFKLWNVDITKDVATCLYMGIYTDSMFKYAPTDFRTFEIAAELTKIFPNFTKLIFDLENSNTPGRLIFRRLLLNQLKLYFNNSVAISDISYSQLHEHGIAPEDTEKNDVENEFKSVIGWLMGIKVVERNPGEVNISFRTRDSEKYDVAQLATLLGGGGHKAASGARILGTLEEAKQRLFTAIQQLHPELGRP